MDQKDYPTAAQDYRDYLAKKPEDAAAHFGLGYADMSMQRLGEAKAEYEKAISLDPKMAPAYLNLGLTLIDGDPAAALVPLQKAVELIPNESGPKYLLGLAWERTDKLAAAVEQYQLAAALTGDDFNIRICAGPRAAGRVRGRPGDAEPEFRAALTLRPDSAPFPSGAGSKSRGTEKI